MDVPETRYAKSGDVHIAYQVVGDGSVDLVWVPGFAQHVELAWEEPYRARWLRTLARHFRVIVFDKRGTGLSDPLLGQPSLETRMDDIRAVLDAARSQSAVVFAVRDGVPLAVVFAATHPARARALVLVDGWARWVWAADYPWAPTREDRVEEIAELERRWGQSFLTEMIRAGSPSLSDDECAAFARIMRLSVSPGAAVAYQRLNLDVDVRGVLAAVHVPTLVVRRTDADPAEPARFLASGISTAELVEVPGADRSAIVGDIEPLIREVVRFADAATTHLEPERTLTTVLFTDLVDSTATAAAIGDRAWRDLLQDHHAATRRMLARFRGVEHDTAGDGFFASFDGPARAIRCACSIRAELRALGLGMRAGLHTGEGEVVDGKVAGLAVSIGARVAAQAGAGEVLVSQTVKDLVAGSGLEFEDRGTTELKGVPGEWRVYAVAEAAA